jgi:phage antirepressor YoqD-like protein
MNELEVSNKPLLAALATPDVETMSSSQIAQVVKSRHDKVIQSIDRCVNRGVIIQPPMGDEQSMDVMGRARTTKVYQLDKRSSYIVVAQLSPEFTAQLVDYWQEREVEKAPKIPQTYAQALMDAALKAVKIEKQQYQLQLQQEQLTLAAPAVEFVEDYVEADGSVSFTVVAKMLEVKRSVFLEALKKAKVLFKQGRGGIWQAYAPYLQKDYFVVKTSENNGKMCFSTKVTPSGVVFLSEKFKTISA